MPNKGNDNTPATRRTNLRYVTGVVWLDQYMERRRGRQSGVSQRGNPPQYNAESGATWRPNPTLEPEQAAKLYQAMRAMGTSASGVINELIARMDVDEETGLPTWAQPTNTQGTLVGLSADRANTRAAA